MLVSSSMSVCFDGVAREAGVICLFEGTESDDAHKRWQERGI
jgi:hypothetical protein